MSGTFVLPPIENFPQCDYSVTDPSWNPASFTAISVGATSLVAGNRILWAAGSAQGPYVVSVGGTTGCVAALSTTDVPKLNARVNVGSDTWINTSGSVFAFSLVGGDRNIAPNHPHIYWSGNCYVHGADYVLMLTPGQYCVVTFWGSSLSITLDVSAFVANSDAAGNYPTVRHNADGGAFSANVQLTATTTSYKVTGLTYGWHTIRFEFDSVYGTDDCWTTPVGALKVTGFTLPYPTLIAAPGINTGLLQVDGDSIAAGVNVLGVGSSTGPDGTYYPQVNRAHLAFGRLLATYLGYEYNQIGYGGAGYVTAGIGNVPAYPQNADSYYSGVSKLTAAGLAKKQPDLRMLCFGTNDGSNVCAKWVQQRIRECKAQAPNGQIAVVVPPGGTARSEITSGVTNAIAENADGLVQLVDCGTIAGMTYSDGTHPDTAGHITYAAAIEANLPTLGLGSEVTQIWDFGAKSSLTLDGSGNVSAISSLVGSMTASQATAGTRPIYVPNERHPVIRFEGPGHTARYLAASSAPNVLASGGTIFLVVAHNVNEATVASVMYFNDVVIYLCLTAGNTWGIVEKISSADTQFSSGQTIGGGLALLTITASAISNIYLRTNGGNSTHITTATAFEVVGGQSFGNPYALCACDLAYCMVVNTALSGAPLANVEMQLLRRFRIPKATS